MIVLAEEFTEQATVTNWPIRLALVAGMVAIIVLVLSAMRRGWRSRQRRQADIPPPPVLDAALASAGQGPGVPGLYVGTSMAGDWLDRVAVHGLGVRSRAEVHSTAQGLAIAREGAPSFFIPHADIVGVRVDRGVAGTVRAKDSVIVVTWRLGPVDVDTGFRADDGAGHRTLLDGPMSAFRAGGDGPRRSSTRTSTETSEESSR